MEVSPTSVTISSNNKTPETYEFNYTHENLEYNGVFTPSPYIAKYEFTEILLDFMKKVYEGAQTATYYLLVTLLGVVLAFVWGIAFGALNFAAVFAVQPSLRIVSTSMRWLNIVSVSFNRMCGDPVYASIGLCLSRINGRVAVTYGKMETV